MSCCVSSQLATPSLILLSSLGGAACSLVGTAELSVDEDGDSSATRTGGFGIGASATGAPESQPIPQNAVPRIAEARTRRNGEQARSIVITFPPWLIQPP